MNRRQELQARKQRLQALSHLPGNLVCSDCPEDEPTWASLLKPQTPNGKMLGVLCCYKCYSLHFRLGRKICAVKNIKMAEDWTDAEIEAIELGGGNSVVNAIYESTLNPSDDDKYQVLEDEDEDSDFRQDFIRHKYSELRYFDEHLYQAQLNNRGGSSTSIANSPTTGGPATNDNHQHQHQLQPASNPQGDKSKDFVRKPMRRRSQSFTETINTDDEHEQETTDDEQRLSYHLPGHLLGADSRQQRRRQSMPLQMGSNSHNNDANNASKSKRERRQRRASIRESLQKEAQERRASQIGISGEDLGYGDDHSTSSIESANNKNAEMDSTARRSNRRRRDSIGTSTKGRRSTDRRKSMPSMIAAADNNTVCLSTAPKMPKRCLSDDSGPDDESDYDAEDAFTDHEQQPPPSLESVCAPRMRRMSMPLSLFSSDTEAEEDDMPRPRLSDPTSMAKGNKVSSTYGIDLGYGFDDHHDDDETDGGSNDDKSEQVIKIKPTRMPRRGSAAAARHHVEDTMPPQPQSSQPSKLLGAPAGGSGLSSDELLLDYVDSAPRKEKKRSKRNPTATKEKRNRRMMRRCSTGGAVDKFCAFPKEHGEPGQQFNEDEDDDLGYGEVMDNWIPPSSTVSSSSTTKAVSKKHRAVRRCSTGGAAAIKAHHSSHHESSASSAPKKSKSKAAKVSAKTPPSQEELGDGDLAYEKHHQSAGTRKSLSNEDLGYEDHHSDVSSQKTGAAEDLGYEWGYGYVDSQEGERRERRMSRRGSAASVHDQPDTDTRRARRRLSSTQGGSEHGSRSSSRVRRRSSCGGAYIAESPCRPSPRTQRRSSVGGVVASVPSNPPQRSSLLRTDSVSSICSEVSVNAALLYAGDKKYNQSSDTDSNKPDSPISVAFVASSEGACQPVDADQSQKPSSQEKEADLHAAAAADPKKRRSKKDYWKAKLAEKPKKEPKKDIDILSSRQRARRRGSVGLAA